MRRLDEVEGDKSRMQFGIRIHNTQRKSKEKKNLKMLKETTKRI